MYMSKESFKSIVSMRTFFNIALIILVIDLLAIITNSVFDIIKN